MLLVEHLTAPFICRVPRTNHQERSLRQKCVASGRYLRIQSALGNNSALCFQFRINGYLVKLQNFYLVFVFAASINLGVHLVVPYFQRSFPTPNAEPC